MLSHDQILSFEELARIVRAAHGVAAAPRPHYGSGISASTRYVPSSAAAAKLPP